MRVVALGLIVGACSPAVAVAPHTAKPEPPRGPITSCVAPKVDDLIAAGKLRRALSTLDAWRCPGGEHLAWAPRVKIVGKLGRVDEARALIAKIDGTPWVTPEMRLAAREAENEPAPSKWGVELIPAALASKSQAAIDRAIDLVERAEGAKLTLDLPSRSRLWSRAVAFSPKGDRLAVAHGEWIDVSTAPSWTLVARIPVTEPPLGLTFTSEGDALVSASAKSVRILSLEGKPLQTLEATAPVGLAAGNVWAREGNALVVFDAKTWAPGKPIEAGHPFRHALLSRDGKRAAFAQGTKVDLVDVASGKRAEAALDNGLPESEITALAFSPDSKLLAAGMRWPHSGAIPPNLQGGLTFLDASTGGKLESIVARREVVALSFSPDGKRIASTGSLSTRVWTISRDKKGELRSRQDRRFAGHADATDAVAWHPEGKLLASSSKDGSASVWSLDTHADEIEKAREKNKDDLFALDASDTVDEAIHRFPVVVEPAWTGAFTFANGGALAIGSGPGAINTLSLDGKAPFRRSYENVLGQSPQIVSTAFDPSGLLAYGANDGYLRVLGGKMIATGFRVEQLAFPESGLVAAITGDGSYRSFTLPDTTKDVHSPGKLARRALALSQDGKRYVARATKDKTLVIVESATGKVLRSLDDVEPLLSAVAVSNDGKYVLAAKGASARVHGTDVTLIAHGDVRTVAIDPTAKLFAVGDREGFAWFGVDGKQLGRVETRDVVESVSFTGDRLVAASADGTVSIVSMKTHARVLRAGAGFDGAWVQNAKGQALLFGVAKEAAVCRVGTLVFPLEVCAEELLVERIALE